jgi:hypothetical protein
MTGWHGEQWNFQNYENTTEHSDHWIMTGWHGEQWDFQNNENTTEHSDHWNHDWMAQISCNNFNILNCNQA